MKNLFRILEMVWLITAIACFLITIYFFLVIKDSGSALYFAGVSAISVMIYFKRRHQRKLQQNDNKIKEKQS